VDFLLFGFSNNLFLSSSLGLKALLHLLLSLLLCFFADFLFALDKLLGLQLSFCSSKLFLALNLFGFLLCLDSLLLQEPFLFLDANLEFGLDFLLLDELLALFFVIIGNDFLLSEGCSSNNGLFVSLLFLDLFLLKSHLIVFLNLCFDLGFCISNDLLFFFFKFSFLFFLDFFVFVFRIKLIFDSCFGLSFNSDLLKLKLSLLFLIDFLLSRLLFLFLGICGGLFLVFDLLGGLDESHVFSFLQFLFFKLLLLLKKFMVLVFHFFQGLCLLVSFSLNIISLVDKFLNI